MCSPYGRWSLLRGPRRLLDQLPCNRVLAHRRPLRGPVLREDLHLRVDEMAVAEHLLARLIASGVSELRTDGHGRRCRTGREARRSGGGDESTAPLVLLGHAPEQRVHLQRGQLLGRSGLQRERHARHELALAVDDAGVAPAAAENVDVESLGEIDGRSAGGWAGTHEAENRTDERADPLILIVDWTSRNVDWTLRLHAAIRNPQSEESHFNPLQRVLPR